MAKKPAAQQLCVRKDGYCVKCKRGMWTGPCPGYVTAADINPDSLRGRHEAKGRRTGSTKQRRPSGKDGVGKR